MHGDPLRTVGSPGRHGGTCLYPSTVCVLAFLLHVCGALGLEPGPKHSYRCPACLQVRADEEVPPRVLPLYWLHIPKTGGTTLIRALTEHMCSDTLKSVCGPHDEEEASASPCRPPADSNNIYNNNNNNNNNYNQYDSYYNDSSWHGSPNSDPNSFKRDASDERETDQTRPRLRILSLEDQPSDWKMDQGNRRLYYHRRHLQGLTFPPTSSPRERCVHSFLSEMWAYRRTFYGNPAKGYSDAAHECQQRFVESQLNRDHRPLSPKLLPEFSDWDPGSRVDWRGRVVTFLRRPRQRLLSHFYYRHSTHSSMVVDVRRHKELIPATNAFLRRLENTVSPDEFAAVRQVAGCQMKMLAGHRCLEDVPLLALKAKLPAAIEVLQRHVVFVGLTEHWQLSLCLLHKQLGGGLLSLEDFVANYRPGRVRERGYRRSREDTSVYEPEGTLQGEMSGDGEGGRAGNGSVVKRTSQGMKWYREGMLGDWDDPLDNAVYEEAQQVFVRQLKSAGCGDDVIGLVI
eukprot:jgi/Mesvir1/14762/Mv05403-RA.1